MNRVCHFPTTGVEKQAMLLAMDDMLLPFRHHTCLHLSKPTVRPQPVLTPSDDNPAAPDSQRGT